MTSTVISSAAPFGGLTNDTIASLFGVNLAIIRLQAAVAGAASGFSGTAGTEYEGGTNFGVLAGSAPGSKGADYAFALNTLAGAWATFWTAALPSIEALDNGSPAP